MTEPRDSEGFYSPLECFDCGAQTRVTETRHVPTENAIRRSRVCISCAKRWTTYERYKQAEPKANPLMKRKRFYIEVNLSGQRPVATVR